MYEWLQNHTKVAYYAEEEEFDFDFAEGPGFVGTLETEHEPAGITALGQYFAAASAWLPGNFVIALPVRDEEVREQVLEEVTPHFEHVRQYTTEAEGESVHIAQLKPASRQLFKDTCTSALPVMEDLYRHHDTSVWLRGAVRTVVYYPVNLEALAPYEAEGIEELQAVLRKLYFEPPGEGTAFTPLGWHFDDSLKHSIALRFFAGFVPHLTLGVDADSREVITLQLSNQEYIRPVRLSGGHLNPPRRSGNYLYLDLGRKLVRVIDLSRQTKLESWADLHEGAQIYRIAQGGDFADFDHLTADPLPGGIGFFYEPSVIRSMLAAVNRELESF